MRKYSILIFLCAIIIAFLYFHLYEYLNLKTIKLYQVQIQTWKNIHPVIAIFTYISLFMILIACAIPCATLLTLLGGFLFGNIAILYACFSITFGGMILFLSIRTTLGSYIAARSDHWLKKMESGFLENAFHYILTLRLIPIFPCWISNIGAGIFNVPLFTFLTATLLGIFPSTVVYVLAGRSLDQILENTNTPLIKLLLAPSIIFPLIGLICLSLLPVIYKHIKKIS